MGVVIGWLMILSVLAFFIYLAYRIWGYEIVVTILGGITLGGIAATGILLVGGVL